MRDRKQEEKLNWIEFIWSRSKEASQTKQGRTFLKIVTFLEIGDPERKKIIKHLKNY
ncbi:hypothetical protein ABVN56_11720 (plasmid) [Fusobacterium animalis]